MRSLSRAVVVSALALPLALSGAGLASAHGQQAQKHHPHGWLGAANVCQIISCNFKGEIGSHNHNPVQNFGNLG
ncbi:hypothetical protein GCM10025787_17260 [Saccharopolyspora rosea]|uniref:Uncharacterized protein n=1 Tax=Saccharopolyspora rosea TaxID=524884 RepID=A0ABW3FW22_9PSEU